MEDIFFYDFIYVLEITGIVGGFLVVVGIFTLYLYKKYGIKSNLIGSIVSLILAIPVIAVGAIMCQLVFSNSQTIDQALHSNNTVKSIIEEGKKRSALDVAQETKTSQAVVTAAVVEPVRRSNDDVPKTEISQTVVAETSAPTIEEGKNRSALGAVEYTKNQSVTLKRPYLILGYESERSKLVLIESSEGMRIGDAFEEAKTIVLAYSYELDHQLYQSYVNGSASTTFTETRYAVGIYFYDAENRKLTFCKKLLGAEFPESATSYNGRVSIKDIQEAVHTAK